MRTHILFALALICTIVCVRGAYAGSADAPPLADFESGHFHTDHYVRLAAELQALGRETALARLHEIAWDKRTPGEAIILCRMLFKKRPGNEFRRPAIGEAVFMGSTNFSDWPLEPIELVDGVPFLITRGYLLGGKPEQDSWYLTYAETYADWTDFQYVEITTQQEQAALAKLLLSPKWKTPLTDEQRQFLARQLD
jgi:hypothetical protein